MRLSAVEVNTVARS